MNNQLSQNDSVQTRRCSTCKQDKSVSEFYVHRKHVSGYQTSCKTCQKERMRWRKLEERSGVTLTREQYIAMCAAQDGRCAICEETCEFGELGVDHCHTTGLVRGLLCRPCNLALGAFRDNPETLRRAIKYLERKRKLVAA